MGSRRSFLFYLPESSPFLHINAIAKLALVIAVSVVALSILDFGFNLVVLLFTIALLFVARVPLRNLRMWLYGFGFMLIFLTTMYILLSRVPGDTIYFRFPWGTYVSENTMTRALSVAFRIWSMILIALTFLSTTTDTEVILALAKLRFPYTICFLVSLSLRSILLFTEDWKSILDAYWSKGADVDRGGLIHRLRNYVSVSIPLVVITLNKVKDVDFAAESRGFKLGIINRTYIDSFRWNFGDVVISGGCILAIVIIAVLAFEGRLNMLSIGLLSY
jgi:energy-coupling factor transport system permease protein